MKVKTWIESKYSRQNKEMEEVRVNAEQNVEIDGKCTKNGFNFNKQTPKSPINLITCQKSASRIVAAIKFRRQLFSHSIHFGCFFPQLLNAQSHESSK